MPVVNIDSTLGIRVLSSRELRYSDPGRLGEDRPPHVRAASGLAFANGRLAVIQDDAAFIAMVAGPEVAAIVLPRGPGGRRRFEVALGNKHEKLDLECAVTLGDDLYAFGSGSTEARERIINVGYTTRVISAGPLYRALRDELAGPVNIEGVAAVGHELWLFHRGNCGEGDRGPATVRFPRAGLVKWLAGDGPLPEPSGSSRYVLGDIAGIRFGFTDAVGVGDKAFYIAAAEDSPNAIDDGVIVGAQLGVIETLPNGERSVRATALEIDGQPLKAEGIAFDPKDPRKAYLAIDPDDVDRPARLVEVELIGPW